MNPMWVFVPDLSMIVLRSDFELHVGKRGSEGVHDGNISFLQETSSGRSRLGREEGRGG